MNIWFDLLLLGEKTMKMPMQIHYKLAGYLLKNVFLSKILIEEESNFRIPSNF